MGRLHSKGKGISRSANPYKRSPPQWLKTSPLDVEEHVCKLAKKGHDTISNWGHIARFLRYPCRQVGDRVKNSAPPQEKWSCPGNSGGSIHVNQESGVCLASTWSAIAQTKIQNFASSSSSRVSIASRVTIGPRASFMRQEVILEVLVVHL